MDALELKGTRLAMGIHRKEVKYSPEEQNSIVLTDLSKPHYSVYLLESDLKLCGRSQLWLPSRGLETLSSLGPSLVDYLSPVVGNPPPLLHAEDSPINC